MAQFAFPTVNAPVTSAKERKKRDSVQTLKRRKVLVGRPSKLDRLPLDIVYLLIRMLAPGDLVNLSRTNKLLRSILLSRRSIHVWRAALAGPMAFGCPLCPEDMPEPAWANLLFGEPRCTSCGSGDDTTVTYWELRARLCAQCEKTLLCRTSKIEGSEPFPAGVLATDYVLDRTIVKSRVGKMSRADFSQYECAWKEDVLEYEKFIQRRFCRDFHGLRKSMKMAKDARESIAESCVMWAAQREKAKKSDVTSQKDERVTQIRDRLRALGHELVDINHPSVQCHKELKSTQPMTDRVWQRVGPILCQIVNQLREDRLDSQAQSRARHVHPSREIQDEQPQVEKSRADALRGRVASLYATLLRRSRIAPTSFSFIPGALSLCEFSPPVVNILNKASELSTDVTNNLDQVVSSSLPSVRMWVLLRGDAFRRRLPDSWPIAVAPTSSSTASAFDIDIYAQIAALDLAVYTTRCRRRHAGARPPETIFFGLDALAHNCPSETCQTLELNISIRKDSHAAVLHILDLLGLDPTTTRPSDLDRLNEPFVTTCSSCLDDAEQKYERSKPGVLYQIVKGKACPVKSSGRSLLMARMHRRAWQPMNWRHAVHHLDPSKYKSHRCGPQSLRLLTPEEKLELGRVRKGQGKRETDASRADSWACCRCQVQVTNTPAPDASKLPNWRPNALSLDDVHKHISDAHGITSCVEDVDFFFDRSATRDKYWSFPAMYIEDKEP